MWGDFLEAQGHSFGFRLQGSVRLQGLGLRASSGIYVEPTALRLEAPNFRTLGSSTSGFWLWCTSSVTVQTPLK